MTEHKVVVLGNCGVGKSALTICLVQNIFQEEYDPTIEDNYRKILFVDGEPSALNIIDTAGQEEYLQVSNLHLVRGQAFVLVYSITDLQSFENVSKIHDRVMKAKEVCLVRSNSGRSGSDVPRRSNSSSSISSGHRRSKSSLPELGLTSPRELTTYTRTRPVPMILVGNKSDLEEHRIVSYGAGNNLSKVYQCPFYEVSAKNGTNVNEMFHQLVREIRIHDPDLKTKRESQSKCLIL